LFDYCHHRLNLPFLFAETHIALTILIICHIYDRLYVGVVDYSALVQISISVVTNVDVHGASQYVSGSDESQSSLIVAVDWQWK
jgi:hypothetical protein